MLRPTRRTFLKAAGGLLLATTVPAPSLAGLLDDVFWRHEPKRTPAITPNDEFYITSYRSPPTIRVNEWSLVIKGLVDQPITLNYE
jgi:DMSO/TMAO reductase YedYZ molybdopterin-dependent catalytic subunit